MNDNNLVSCLQHTVDYSIKESDTNVKIARYLLQHLNNKKELNIAQIAEACFTSKASISRFAQKIGFANFNELKRAYQETYIEQQEMKLDVQATKKLDIMEEKQFITHELDLIIEDLQCYRGELDIRQLDHLCEMIHRYPTVHIYATAIPGSMAETIQHQLLMAGKFVEYYPMTADQISLSKQLDKNSLALFISLEGSFLMHRSLTLSITSSAAHSVLITQNPTTKLSSHFDEIIPLGSHARERSGKYKLLFFVESLMHRYYIKYL